MRTFGQEVVPPLNGFAQVKMGHAVAVDRPMVLFAGTVFNPRLSSLECASRIASAKFFSQERTGSKGLVSGTKRPWVKNKRDSRNLLRELRWASADQLETATQAP